MILYFIHQKSMYIFLKNNTCSSYELSNPHNNPVEPSRPIGWDHYFIPVKQIRGKKIDMWYL